MRLPRPCVRPCTLSLRCAKRTYTPGTATAGDLQRFLSGLGLTHAVLVQPSVYGTDNRCLVDALAALGPNAARGVAVVDPHTVTDEELAWLRDAGVRALRVNLESQGERTRERAQAAIAAMASRAAAHELAVQVFIDLPLVGQLANDLSRLKVPLVLDHFGGARTGSGLDQSGFRAHPVAPRPDSSG